jgi:hypothetical protein
MCVTVPMPDRSKSPVTREPGAAQPVPQQVQAVGGEAGAGQRRPQRHQVQPLDRCRAGLVEILGHGHGIIFQPVDGQGSLEPDAVRLALFCQVATLKRLHKLLHLAERRDAGDRFRAVGPGVGDGPQELAVDGDGAAAHAGDDPGLLQAEPGEPAQDHVAAGAGIFQHAQDLGIEAFELGAFHDGLPLALHAGADLVHLPVGFRLGAGVSREEGEGSERQTERGGE